MEGSSFSISEVSSTMLITLYTRARESISKPGNISFKNVVVEIGKQ